MLIGRETAGWNTNNSLNTIHRIQDEGVERVVDEGIKRYQKHLKIDSKGKVKVTSRSRFKQYYFKIAKDLNLYPKSIIYSNFFAWDYNKKSPLLRPQKEFDEIKKASLRLLAAQIQVCKPDYIIFATGIRKVIDDSIKELFELYFDGYQTVSDTFVSKKFWEFDAAGAKCFRIAHPRATNGHGEFRKLILSQLKDEHDR